MTTRNETDVAAPELTDVVLNSSCAFTHSPVRTNGDKSATPRTILFMTAENYQQIHISQWLQEVFPESSTASAITPTSKSAVAVSSNNENDRLNILSSLDHMDVLQLIISFVGDHQYRFVAAVNQSFRTAYANEFRNETSTYLNTSTVAHAKICYEELNSDTMSDASFDSWGDSFACDDDDDDDEDDCGCGNGCGCGWRLQLNRECILCRSAAKHNNLAALMYLKSEHCEWDERTCIVAAENGNFDLLAWAIDEDCPWDWRTANCMEKHNCLDVLKWVIEQGSRVDAIFIYFSAASQGNLEVLQWAFDKFTIPEDTDHLDWIYEAASENGHEHILRYLKQEQEGHFGSTESIEIDEAVEAAIDVALERVHDIFSRSRTNQ